MLTKQQRTSKYFEFISHAKNLTGKMEKYVDEAAQSDTAVDDVVEGLSNLVPKLNMGDMQDVHLRDAILVWTLKQDEPTTVKAVISLMLRPMDADEDIHANTEGAMQSCAAAAALSMLCGEYGFALSLMGRAKMRSVKTKTELPDFAEMMIEALLIASVEADGACAILHEAIVQSDSDELWENFDHEVDETELRKAFGI